MLIYYTTISFNNQFKSSKQISKLKKNLAQNLAEDVIWIIKIHLNH